MDKNYNKIYQTGDYKNKKINVVIEIPTGSTEKIEWNRITFKFDVDREEPSLFPEPANYGFIPKTTGGDSDNLDVIVLSDEPIPTGSVIGANIIGVMKFLDNNDVDDKIIATAESGTTQILSEQKKNQLEHYFSHYKDYIKPGMTQVLRWAGPKDAETVIDDSVKLFNQENN